MQKERGEPIEEMSLLLENLEKFTKYTIFVRAYNRVGTGPKNQPEVVAKTDEDGEH